LAAVVPQPRELDVSDVSPPIEVQEIRVGHRSVLAVSGELDLATAGTLQAAIEHAVASGAADVWVDLSRVPFMDSTGLRVLLVAQALLRERSKSLAIICPPGAVRRVFEISGVDRSLAIHPDRATAHAAG
jgi:anti-sigma B factor antagonist